MKRKVKKMIYPPRVKEYEKLQFFKNKDYTKIEGNETV